LRWRSRFHHKNLGPDALIHLAAVFGVIAISRAQLAAMISSGDANRIERCGQDIAASRIGFTGFRA